MVSVTGKRLQKNGVRQSVKGCKKMVSVTGKRLQKNGVRQLEIFFVSVTKIYLPLKSTEVKF